MLAHMKALKVSVYYLHQLRELSEFNIYFSLLTVFIFIPNQCIGNVLVLFQLDNCLELVLRLSTFNTTALQLRTFLTVMPGQDATILRCKLNIIY